MPNDKWIIVTEPQGRDLNRPNIEKNKGGLVFFLQKVTEGGSITSYRQEVARVAFERSQSKNPRTSFATQCDKVAKTAIAAVTILNTDLMGDGELQ